MNLSLVATILWTAGFILNAVLLFVLLYRRRYKVVPWFTAWMGFQIVCTISLYLAYRFSSRHDYLVIYWSAFLIDVLFQIAVVFEIASSALRRGGRWVEGARARLLWMGLGALAVSSAMAWKMHPAAETRPDFWAARASLFTTLLICLLFTGVMMASQQLGLSWRSHAMREGYGLTIWALVAFLTDTLHAYWRTMSHFGALEHIRMAFYLGSLLYWTVAFWIPEQESVPLTTEARKSLEAFGKRLEYGVSSGASRSDGALPK